MGLTPNYMDCEHLWQNQKGLKGKRLTSWRKPEVGASGNDWAELLRFYKGWGSADKRHAVWFTAAISTNKQWLKLRRYGGIL